MVKKHETQNTEETKGQEEQTQQAAAAAPEAELKVVVIMRGIRAMIGVQSPDCDPVFTTVEGDLAAALAQVPPLVEKAKAQWNAHPRYPKADLPQPAPATSPRTASTASSTLKPKKAQPSFF